MYSPQDFERKVVRQDYVGERPYKQRYVTAVIPAGIGLDYYINQDLAITAQIYNNYTFVDDLDAFDSGFIRSLRFKKENPEQAAETTTEATDSYGLINIGIKYFIFSNPDIDGDGLSNDEEKQFGSNPNDIDTDGDGLTDYEEIKIYHTNPLKKDTDDDGLSDYEEVHQYHTNPLEADTDGDGINDFYEVTMYKSNPLKRDSDDDGIPDGEEIKYKTDSNYFDSDHDGLSDYDEIYIYKTDPTKADTDGDGLTDREESSNKTDPRNVDTDGDGLTDFEEVKIYHTNPLLVDTDGDSLSDYVEVKQLGTNPLIRDTDGDGIPDNLDLCPTTFGIAEHDGCPDIKTKPESVRKTTRQLADSLVLEEHQSYVLSSIQFDPDEATIKFDSYPKLEEVKNLFSIYPFLVAEIHGFTDASGTTGINKSLSLLRAQAVREWLIQHGVHPGRIIARGYGQNNPIAPNTSRDGRNKNRRIELYVVSLSAAKENRERK